MRIKSYVDGGHAGQGIFTSQGASLTGPLILTGDPVEEMEAATKDYVDQNSQDLISQGVAAEDFVSGGVAPAVLPAFSGDVSNVQGSNVFNLPVSGVVSGTYPKVEVDAKGLVVSGSELVEDDIPSLPWGKITSGRPTSVSGLGIGDLLSREGGELTGGIEAHAHPVNEKNPSTVGYIRGKAEVFPNIYKVGDVVSKPTDVTSFGFLKCNGGLVSKEIYADLYSVIGDRFNIGTIPGAGKPWKQQYDINTVGDSLGAWTTATTSLPQALILSQAIVTKNRVYLLGGHGAGVAYTSTVYTAPINEDGTLGAWTTGVSLPGALGHSQAVVTSNRVYLLGGINDSRAVVSTVYTAPINEDGTLGAWTTATSLPGVLGRSQAVVTSNRVYLLGGFNDSSIVSTVYTAPINEDGTLGAWTTVNSLPGALAYSQAIVTSSRVYLLGGEVSSIVSTVYTAPINEDGTLGAWTTGARLPGDLGGSQAVVTSNRVYLLGGRKFKPTGEGIGLSTVYTAPINEDGTLGGWTTTTSLPQALVHSQVIVTSNRVYLLGGRINEDGNTYIDAATVYTATFSGGKNDYSEYYDGTPNLKYIPEGMFYLPREENNLGKDIYNYIKY